MRALLVGGAGATGVLIASGLSERGYTLTILHRGTHEAAELDRYEHIHADPHFAASVAEAIGARTWDLVVLSYGRLSELAPLFAGRCGQLIAIGGIPIYPGYLAPKAVSPTGMRLLSQESDPRADPDAMAESGAARFVRKMLAAEDAVLLQHARGAYRASLFRYPAIYGPRSLSLGDWSFIKRIKDKRRFALMPDAGLGIITRCAALNAAYCVLSALDHDEAWGQIFNCADEDQYSFRQWAELIFSALGDELELIPLPPQLNWVSAHWLPLGGTCTDHGLVDITKSRSLLHYRDRISAKEALAQSIQWRIANPPTERELSNGADKFDYATEDRVCETLQGAISALDAVRKEPQVIHPYPHPKTPGQLLDHRGR